MFPSSPVGRINPHTRANYLTSPPLCIAYAIAGTVSIDFETEPLGEGSHTHMHTHTPTHTHTHT